MNLEGWPPPVGSTLRIDYGPDNSNNHLLHVRGHVDGLAVVRRWSKVRGWQYSVMLPEDWHVLRGGLGTGESCLRVVLPRMARPKRRG